MIPALIFPHITIEEINSLVSDEIDMLLYICNVWAPIKPPMPTEDNKYPISIDIVRMVRRDAILDRVKQAESIIKDEYKLLYNSLREKFSIPVEKKVEETVVSDSISTNTGSINLITGTTSESGSVI